MTYSDTDKNTFTVPFHSIRNISSPTDSANDRKVYLGQLPILSVLDFPTDDNVRDYLLEAEGKARKRPTQVHKAIRETLLNSPDNFSLLNGGLTLVARGFDVDEKRKHLKLVRPSIIDGAQTQGVIRDFVSEYGEDLVTEIENIFTKVEVIVTTDEDLVAEISIARNFQNDVMPISIVGRLGILDELEERMRKQKNDSSLKLKKSETKLSDDYIPSERLLQVITALRPTELWPGRNEPNKVFTYNMKSKCLKLFQEIHKKAKDNNHEDHQKYAPIYDYYLDIAATAWSLYDKWKHHNGFKGSGLRSIKRDSYGNVVEVPDGIVFPIIAALSEFVVKENGKWVYSPPKLFDEAKLIQAAKQTYMDIANSSPMIMGKSKSSYSALSQITQIYKSLG